MSEWIDWLGGVCPVDVATKVFVRHRSGWESQGPCDAGLCRWDHGRTPDSSLRNNDIVAYRTTHQEKD